ncbi:MAG: permease-like cell division protein FtsX [Erysipelotrichaceae bacterium]|nr:permease-like cell division protein FtsX [Erysipelotrichaceae bacterium]MDY5727276.1 permease-like cell division protein FtsX [Erysipelotrichaceae bacterium]
MFRKIGRSFKEAFWGITHHVAMVISTANAVTITLVLVSVLSLLIANISQITYDVEDDIQLYVKIENEVLDEDIQSIQNKISRIAGVEEIEYSDADNELDRFIAAYGEAGKIYEIYRQDNPLSRVFIIKVANGYSLAELSTQISTVEGIQSVDFGGATVEDFVKLLNGIREVGTIFVIALALLAIFLIYNTIKITINSRKEEIGIMRLVGATNSYIRSPLVLEGMFIGVLGSIIPILLTIFGYNYIYTSLNGQLVSGILKLIDVFPFTLWVSLLVLVAGVTVGVIGSYISATIYLRYKR